jgi:hypothetical protein
MHPLFLISVIFYASVMHSQWPKNVHGNFHMRDDVAPSEWSVDLPIGVITVAAKLIPAGPEYTVCLKSVSFIYFIINLELSLSNHGVHHV